MQVTNVIEHNIFYIIIYYNLKIIIYILNFKMILHYFKGILGFKKLSCIENGHIVVHINKITIYT